MERIYVDHAATSPLHPNVIKTMLSVMENEFGNPSSIHSFGREARRLVDEAREVLANSIHASEKEIIFTSGGSEADNLALIGICEAYKEKGRHIITTSIEHHAVLHTCEQLEKRGYEVTYLPVDNTGVISVTDLKRALRNDTIVVSIMYGNNEVGTIQPIKEIGQLLEHHQAKFHTDAVQVYGIEKIDVNELKVDLLSVSAHKINGPKGIGFLYVRDGIQLVPAIFGGEQERKRRAGTENVAAIAGFKEAVLIAQRELDKRRIQYQSYKKLIRDYFQKEEINYHINGKCEQTLPHIMNISFSGINVEAMLVNLDLAGVAASSGSACTAGSIEPSHVLVAMFGNESERIHTSIRFSFGLMNTREQIEQLAKIVAIIVKRLMR
ncbi:cysteine desulfurase [Bacillus aquiflavi]|uniref:cysteine desulfurase n=1 Tax=Bacillus aquiflavi TaxID=2672567 RepID=A0A6B3W5U2_9BACI|nr:cysteine desulfurase family protein [Bacillus aquiflavi]MBA4538440.1 cysteine desulfurase [Bacillus aquiflavi]NEY82804.1 cysteine desulfurase [Bacillus aquiflavi]